MQPFITVSLILDALKNERGSNAAPSRAEEASRFLDWKEGFLIKHKNDRATTWKIASVDNADDDGTLNYKCQVHLANVDDPEETRSLRGATVQQAYEFVSRGDVPMAPEEVKKTTKPMTIAVDTIRSFAPRTKGRPGSRIVLKDGASYVAVEDHDTILQRIGKPLEAA